jgi:hypothetical protein
MVGGGRLSAMAGQRSSVRCRREGGRPLPHRPRPPAASEPVAHEGLSWSGRRHGRAHDRRTAGTRLARRVRPESRHAAERAERLRGRRRIGTCGRGGTDRLAHHVG